MQDIPRMIEGLLTSGYYGTSVSCAAWEDKERAQNPLYRHDVFHTLLFFSLLNETIFQHIALDIWPAENITKPVHYMETRRTGIRSHLIKMPEFKNFLEQYGDQSIAAIEERIKEANGETDKKIKKFRERITLFNEHKTDYRTLPEYQYLVRKVRYQNLDYQQFIDIFNDRIRAYERRLINVPQVKTSYEKLTNDLRLTKKTSPVVSFFAKAKDQKRLVDLKKQYEENHPIGGVDALQGLLNRPPLDEKAINSLSEKLNKIITNMPPLFNEDDCKEGASPPNELITKLINTAISASEKKMDNTATKMALCVTHLTKRPYIEGKTNRKTEIIQKKFVNILFQSAKESKSEIPLRMAYRLVDWPEEDLQEKVGEYKLQDLWDRAVSLEHERRRQIKSSR